MHSYRLLSSSPSGLTRHRSSRGQRGPGCGRVDARLRRTARQSTLHQEALRPRDSGASVSCQRDGSFAFSHVASHLRLAGWARNRFVTRGSSAGPSRWRKVTRRKPALPRLSAPAEGSADFQSAESHGFQPAGRGQVGRFRLFVAPADWRSATQRVRNLRYFTTAPPTRGCHPERKPVQTVIAPARELCYTSAP